ncbi:hypothetical protein [Sphingomonas aracearum]|uniref:Uncharacterized protein n=1 Tax=Sphingomonas aracearum TaxID=2283317 RepID=A0A369VVH0_9SPHN|nr:hypothetical protein [Sphingomonas aracearum]RDE05849.1 hypothetical protein DVW87_11710 [Sphingomonas aracearum]
MHFFRRFAPWQALQDLRRFLAQRKPYELGFFFLSVLITGAIIMGFAIDSYAPPTYKRDIIYFQNWRADRTDAQIIAQQKLDAPKEAAAKKAQEQREAAVRAQFKQIDDKLTKWGL